MTVDEQLLELATTTPHSIDEICKVFDQVKTVEATGIVLRVADRNAITPFQVIDIINTLDTELLGL